MDSSIKNKVVSGSLWNLIGTIGYQALGLSIFIILSRLLAPEEFGVVALGVAVVELLTLCVQLGMTEVIIREKNLDRLTKNTIFWMCITVGVICCIFILLTAESFGLLFDSNELGEVMKMLSVIPIFHALSVIPDGVLKREFKYKSLAFRIVISTFISGGLSIMLAVNDAGLYSLVFQRVSSFVLIFVILWNSYRYFPEFSFSFSKARELLSYSKSIVAVTVLNIGVYRVIEFSMGFFLGMAAVGYYKIAGKVHDFIVQIFIKPMLDVSMSTFSLMKGDANRINEAYVNFIEVTAVFAIPGFIGIYSLSPDIIVYVFGDKWDVAGELLKILCLACISSTLNYYFSPLVNSIGRPDLAFKLKLFEIILVSIGLFLSYSYGLSAFVASYVISVSIVSLIMFVIMSKELGVEMIKIFSGLVGPLVSSLCMFLSIVMVKKYMTSPYEASDILIMIVVGLVVYLLAFCFFFRGRFERLRKEAFNIFRKA